ncbi:MAG: serine/threonine protein kinase [Planctomycetes bacterium]|nr:serine/threonine protein kinase [Planctomycetota bacterium]
MTFTYRTVSLLGKGSFGEVFRGVQDQTGGLVAIKFLLREQELALDRFQSEAQLLQRLSNEQHVVRILDMNLGTPRPFIVLEYCDRGTLHSMIKRLQWRDVCNVVGHVATALSSVHALGSFHRDVKPANILLQTVPGSRQFIAKLGDFGVARNNRPVYGNLTFSACGTPGYMAPELDHGHPFSAAADVYSLGITAVEVLTGSRSVTALGGARIPPELREYIKKMSSPSAGDRPTAVEVVESMRQFVKLPDPPAESKRSGAGAALVGAGVGVVIAALLIGLLSSRK